MSLELVDAGSCLETEYINVKVLSSYSKTVLTRQLASTWNATIENEEWFLLINLISL